MGAESSVQREGKVQEEDAAASSSGGELSAQPGRQEDGVLDGKALQKNGQISSMTSLNGHSEDNTLAEVGQPDGVSVGQKEETSETMETIPDEVAPQVNGEKGEKESSDANDITAVEEKEVEEKPNDANEVGFKKIFRFVGFKFTLKKDKSEEKDPVKLLAVKDQEGEEVSGTDEPGKDKDAATPEEKSTMEEKEADTEASTAEADVTKETDKDETTDTAAESAAAEASDEVAKEEGDNKEDETTPPSEETTLSPFRKFFSGGLFSNLRKKASIKKTKDEPEKEAAVEEETAKTDETAVEKKEEDVATVQQSKEDAPESPVQEKSDSKEDAPTSPVEEKSEPKEEAPTIPVEEKSEAAPETESSVETPPPVEEGKQEDQKTEDNVQEDKVPAEVTTEAELLSSQEKTKPQGSPLKKLFTGAGLKKLSTKKQKAKKETESKLTESGEQAAEQLQSSTESSEPPKADSGPSSPEESGEHVISSVEVTQNESTQEAEAEVVSDGEKKKEGIIAWSSFKKLVTPKKRVKRPSESEDEATNDKPGKSATLSSSESAALADKSVEEEAKEEKPAEEEPKTEHTEKLVSSTEEPKRKMDTSVSWEALMCMGGPKKRSRKTSDSDDDETRIEEDGAAAAEVEKEGKNEAALVTSQTTESEGEAVSSPEPLSPPERESTWDTLKRIVMPKSRSKGDEKLDDSTEQVQSDSEIPKDESSFSLRKLFPGRKKKKVDKQSSLDQGSGEEDSDTPAVVPMSEYEQQEESEPDTTTKPETIQIKVSAVSVEDRAPSWIPASVEDPDEKQLSDIPEEAENAATPKSIDTDIADDEAEDQAAILKASARSGRRLSTAEVKPVTPAPNAATTPVPQGPQSERAEEVLEGIEAQCSEIATHMSVAVQDLAFETASEQTEYEPPTENATSVTNAILQPHARNEAMAICTGLGTKEIAKVALEKPVFPVVEAVTVVRDSLLSEVLVEDKPAASEEAVVADDELLQAQLHQVESTYLEASVVNSESDALLLQTASETVEPQIEKVGAISTAVEQSEVIELPAVTENSPKVVIVSPITPTCEATVCTQSVEISEMTIDTKEVKMELEHLGATEENTPIEEFIQVLSEEMTSTFHRVQSKTCTVSEEAEPANLVVVSDEDTPVVTETVVLVAPPAAEYDQTDTSDMVTEQESGAEPADAEPVQAETTAINTDSEISEVIKEEVSEKAGEVVAQSMAVTQSAIEDAVNEISDDASETQEAETPAATISGAAQAVSTTEKQIDVTTPVVTDTPVPVLCEKLFAAVEVVDTIPLEVTMTLDEEKGEKEPKESVNEAVEVKVSEEIFVEEVVEMMDESQTNEEPEQIKEEESKEDEKPSEESQPEETKSEAPAEEINKKALEIHMPIQVVLQTAQVLEDPSVEEEAAEEFGSNSNEAEDTRKSHESDAHESKLPVLLEEPQTSDSAVVGDPGETTDAAETEKAPSAKCAEVMAQVIEVIEEAVKEIEPVSTELTAAS